MHRFKVLFFVLLCANSIASATNYYVSSSKGSDNPFADGKSEASAWKSIAKVNRMDFLPGDSILFRRGDTWREMLTVPSSGTTDSFITFASYGSGFNPTILGSMVSNGWTNYKGNIWVSNTKFTNPRSNFSCDIFFLGKDKSVSWGVYKTNSVALTSEHDWTWNGNRIYIYSTSDPSAGYSEIEIPQRRACINLNNKEFIGIKGIDLFYSVFEGITYNWSYPQLDLKGLKIDNCRIAFVGGNITDPGDENGFGIDAVYSDMIVKNCEIHHCGRRGLSLSLYGRGFIVKNVLIEQNYFHDGYHTTGIDISVGSSFYTAGINGVVIRRNVFSDPPASSSSSNQIFIQNQKDSNGSVIVNNIYIYSNLFLYPSYASVMAEGCQGFFIYNNTFYNHNTTKKGNIIHLWIDANNSSVKVKNNIFYSELDNEKNGNGIELFCLTDHQKVDSDYNLFYRINSSFRIISFAAENFSSLQIAGVRSGYGWETHSPAPANPKFVSSTDFHLKPGSPAIGAGIDLSLPVDFYGEKFNSGNPSIGAIESKAAKVDRPVTKRKQ